MKFKERNYQRFAKAHVINNSYAGLFMDMGLGKTVVMLNAIDYFMYEDLSINKTLVIAPYNVADTVWTGERDLWDHLRHIRISKVMGTVAERLAGLKAKADIYVINRENLSWLQTHYATGWPFDCVVFDESSSFKSPDSARFRAARMVLPKMRRRYILSGTPSPNGLADLWSQMYLLDRGERLGEKVTDYRNKYLYPEKIKDNRVLKYGCVPDNEKEIYRLIGDICISMKTEDYLELPERLEIDHKINLPKKVYEQYKKFEKEQVLSFYDQTQESEKNIYALSAAALGGKLLQFASGAVYDAEGDYSVVHETKTDAIGEIVEAATDPLLITYNYRHELYRMQKRFGGHLYKKRSGDVERWNNKEFEIMYLNPKAGGHGLNLQAGGCEVIWPGPTYNLEDWLQFNKRLHRSGQTKPVKIHKFRAVGTMDTDAYHALDIKDRTQNSLLNAVKALVKKHVGL